MINYHHVCWLYAAHCCAIFCTFHPIPKLLLPILSLQHQWNIPVRLDAMLICWVCLRIEDPPHKQERKYGLSAVSYIVKGPWFFLFNTLLFYVFVKLFYFEWSLPWNFKTYFDTYSDIFPNILSDIHSRRKLQESNLILGNVLWQPVWHMYHIKYLRVEMQLPSDINKKASWYMPKLIMTVYAAYVSGISSDILSGILSDISSQLLCGRGPARITFIQQLLFRSGGDHCDRALAVEVRRGPLWSGACCSGPSGTTPITSLAVEVRRGTLWSWACCSGPAGTTAITSLQLRSAEEEKKEEGSLHKI